MNKYEQLIEHIINDETAKARELFHTIVVEKSRDIYESLVDESDLEEVGGNKVQGYMDDVQVDEQGMNEEDEEFGADEMGLDDEDGESDFDIAGETNGDEHGEAEIEDRVVDLESALDELKAEFDALMAGEENEEEHADMFGGEEEGEFDDNADDMGDDMGDGTPGMMSDEDDMDGSMVREYVEKVAAPSNTAAKSKSPVAGKNDMGGSAKNIVRGGTGADVTAEKAQKMNTKNINVPGGKAGNAFSTKEKAVTTETRKRK
jgi:hypothetical protein